MTPFSFRAFPFPRSHFRVHRVRGREVLSKPYVFRVTVSTAHLVGDDLERLAVGHRAALVIRGFGAPRVVSGIVESIRSEGVDDDGRTARFTFRVVPALALLKRQRRSRIFQDLRVDEVVTSVLRDAGIPVRWDLTRAYPVRPFTTQYEESDLAFVERLLAEAGIFYFFASSEEPGTFEEALSAVGEAVLSTAADTVVSAVELVASAASGARLPEETVVFGDDASSYSLVSTDETSAAASAVATALRAASGVSLGTAMLAIPAPTLAYARALGAGMESPNHVTAFSSSRRVRSEVAEYREFDPARPGTPLGGRAGVATAASAPIAGLAEATLSATLEAGLSVAASLDLGDAAEALLGLVSTHALETYEHHGDFLFPDWRDAGENAAKIQRATTRRRVVAEGASACSGLSPGRRFRLEDHPIGRLNVEHAVIAVEHRGEVGKAASIYTNTFTCVPGRVAYVPRRPARRAVQALLTATVVGPPGEEIHVDEAGRIKVRFHWDRRGATGDRASCWIRSVQPWAGAAFGHQFFPRVGMEVAVAFDGGDPDKPIVIGSLYNGTHVPPFPLPASKTQSGIRTRSSPGGAGHNELMFDDSAARERVSLRAQRDLDLVVLRNRTLAVGADDTATVEGVRRESIGGDAHSDVRGNREDVVRKDASIHHLGSRLDVVERSLDQRIGDARRTRVEGREELDVFGSAEHRFAGDCTMRVAGHHTVVVGKHESPRSLTIRVEGSGTFSAEDVLELASNRGIVLRCGATSLRIGPDGLELTGGSIRAAGKSGAVEVGSEGLKLTSEGVYVHLGEQVLLKTDDASLSMGSEIRLDGKRILLNSPESASDAPPPEREPPTEIELRDTGGAPLARQRFVIDLDDGSQRSSITDEHGRATLDLPTGGTIRFPELTNVTKS